MRGARLAAGLAALAIALPASAGRIDLLSERDAVAGLKAALEQGSRSAVSALGRTDGFFRDARVKIPLPPSLARADRLMRRFGFGRQADELVLTMNRAAEAAVPEAKTLLLQSIRRMTLADAKGILTGGDTAATDYFRRTTRAPLRARFLPIVKRATEKVGLARAYERYAGTVAEFGLIDRRDADLDAYVAEKALDGLYFMIGEEEKKIRKDPLSAGKRIARKVFGALKL